MNLKIYTLVFLSVITYISSKKHFHSKKHSVKRDDWHLIEEQRDGNPFISSYTEQNADSLTTCSRVKEQYKYTSNDFILLLLNLERMVDFMRTNKQQIIVDGLYGLRIAEGTLKDALKQLGKEDERYDFLKVLVQKMSAVGEEIFNSMVQQNNTYTNQFKPILDRPMEYSVEWYNYYPKIVYKKQKVNEFSEAKSDYCISLLLGTSTAPKKKCQITKECLTMETQKYSKGYTLTHQLLYFLIGEVLGCKKKLASAVGGVSHLGRLHKQLATNVYHQMLSNRGFNNLDNTDLFFEQSFVCALFGIVECINFYDVRRSFKLVTNAGCIKGDTDVATSKNTKREDFIIGKCSQHITSVAMGYFAQHLRFMVNLPPCSIVQY